MRTYAKREDVIVKEMGDETVLYDQTLNLVHSLNVTASIIWELCDGEKGLDEIIQGILEKFDVDEKTARKDTEKTLAEFKEKGFLIEKT